MKRKKNSKEEIVSAYVQETLEGNTSINNIYSFCKKLELDEKEFYTHFSSFESLEKEIFKLYFDNASTLLSKNPQYLEFDSRNKLLSLYFTIFEVLKENRSFILHVYKHSKSKIDFLNKLSRLKDSFSVFIEELKLESMPIKQATLQQIQQKGIKETIWLQFIGILHFWISDESAGFEKTDMLIEKSTHVGFDVLDLKLPESIIDFGKFLFKEKIK